MKKIKNYSIENFKRDSFAIFSDIIKLGSIALPILSPSGTGGFYLGLGAITFSYSVYTDSKVEGFFHGVGVGKDDIYRNLPIVKEYRSLF